MPSTAESAPGRRAGQPSQAAPQRGRRSRRRHVLRRRDFERITRGHRRISSRYFLVYLTPQPDAEPRGSEPADVAGPAPPRLGLTVTRKVGPAVRRNRLKRLVREWFRARAPSLGAVDVVVIVKRGVPTDLVQSEVSRDMDQALRGRTPQ